MDMLKQLNDAISYIEANLCDEINLETVAQTACVTKDSFIRFFSYMTGMTLNEYIRRRRLTLAAYELQSSNSKVIDVAVKYGWNSADAFTKAFTQQHSITPTQSRDPHESLKIYPPASFYIMIKGAKEMDFRMIELKETGVYGVSKQFDGQDYKTREELRHIMWSEDCDDIPGQICEGRWNQSQNHSYDGVWYGIWQEGKYAVLPPGCQVRSTNKKAIVLLKSCICGQIMICGTKTDIMRFGYPFSRYKQYDCRYERSYQSVSPYRTH